MTSQNSPERLCEDTQRGHQTPKNFQKDSNILFANHDIGEASVPLGQEYLGFTTLNVPNSRGEQSSAPLSARSRIRRSKQSRAQSQMRSHMVQQCYQNALQDFRIKSKGQQVQIIIKNTFYNGNGRKEEGQGINEEFRISSNRSKSRVKK